jgi:hypothetical protein
MLVDSGYIARKECRADNFIFRLRGFPGVLRILMYLLIAQSN